MPPEALAVASLQFMTRVFPSTFPRVNAVLLPISPFSLPTTIDLPASYPAGLAAVDSVFERRRVSESCRFNMARISTVVFTLGLALFTTATSNNGSCYWLDGTAAPYHAPCSNAAVTNCCLSSALCMSNGLCYLQDDMGLMLTRGACTDQNWSSACFAPCCMWEYPGQGHVECEFGD